MEPEETSKHQRHHRISAVSIFNGEIVRAASAQIEEVAMCHYVSLHFPFWQPFPGAKVCIHVEILRNAHEAARNVEHH